MTWINFIKPASLNRMHGGAKHLSVYHYPLPHTKINTPPQTALIQSGALILTRAPLQIVHWWSHLTSKHIFSPAPRHQIKRPARNAHTPADLSTTFVVTFMTQSSQFSLPRLRSLLRYTTSFKHWRLHQGSKNNSDSLAGTSFKTDIADSAHSAMSPP